MALGGAVGFTLPSLLGTCRSTPSVTSNRRAIAPPADPTPADLYHGPAELFAAAGFEVQGETDDVTVMRRRLA